MLFKKKVLIVEDNEINREMLCSILSDDYNVLQAENGQQALDILRQYSDSISLILLDVNMPVMDGFTFLDTIKEDKELSLIPVIVTTQNNNESDEIEALNHGATDFVPKPYRTQIILHRVAAIIKLRESAAMVNQLKYDSLTGLYSRDYFYQKVKQRLAEYPDEDYCIVCSNIENFKLVKSNLGASESERLLKKVAAITARVAGSTGLCGRIGVDHFSCLIKCDAGHNFSKENLLGVGEDISHPMKGVVLRWGAYEITDRSMPVEHMCDRAVFAMESIKNQYNRYFVVYNDFFRKKRMRERDITVAMESALQEGQFTVYFQPKYSLKTNSMVGAEALVRWIHPEWGVVSCEEFIPLFENNGFISKLDYYVCEQVCIQLRLWKEKGYPDLPVSVNVSRADMFEDDLPEIILGLVEKYGIDVTCLHLEVTESAYAENPDQIIKTVDKFRRLGFIVEMDDFGSGYSSLNMLARMSLDILKLDMKFIQSEMDKPTEYSMLGDIVNMAHRAHLSVIAEGVETREQLERMRTIGCDYAQGYFFAKPMPADGFEQLLKTWQQQGGCVDPRSRISGKHNYSLLLIDENDEYRKMVSDVFTERHYRVMEASNVEQALDCIMSADADNISAVILSMTLPENGATQIFDVLRRDPSLREVPILATIPNSSCLNYYPLALETDDFLCKCHPVTDLHRRVRKMIDNVSFHHRESILQDEANHDPLTGLLNRRGLQDAMSDVRDNDMPLAVCIFDLDNMKAVNDAYGHEGGDRMLCSFADLLCNMTRSEDVKCRYGGDEFVVLLKHMKDSDTVLKKVNDICHSFLEKTKEEGLPAACSAGIVMCEPNEKLSTEMIGRADRALYRSKRENKGSACMWNDIADQEK